MSRARHICRSSAWFCSHHRGHSSRSLVAVATSRLLLRLRDLRSLLSSWCLLLPAGAQRPRRQHFSVCNASARQSEGADGGEPAEQPDATESIDAQWRQRRWGSLWTSLAEQDRNWAVHSYTGSESDGGSTSTMDDGWDIDEWMARSGVSWSARSITLSPSSSEQTWLHDKRAVSSGLPLLLVSLVKFGCG